MPDGFESARLYYPDKVKRQRKGRRPRVRSLGSRPWAAEYNPFGVDELRLRNHCRKTWNDWC
jgi:hypothetical protein